MSIKSSFWYIRCCLLTQIQKIYNFLICQVILDPLIAKRSLEFELNEKLKCQARKYKYKTSKQSFKRF
jgi:hypothetical protein